MTELTGVMNPLADTAPILTPEAAEGKSTLTGVMDPLAPGRVEKPSPEVTEAGAPLSVFGTPLPPEPPGSLETLDDTVRMLAEGTPLPVSEFAAGMNALFGIGEGETLSERYANNLEAERARNASIEEREPGAAMTAKIAGGVMSGGAAAKGGLTLMKGASGTLGSLAGRGAVEGAAYGALYGAKEGTGAGERIEGALSGAAIGAATGGLTAAFFWPFLRNANPTTLQGVKDEARVAYQQAEKAGLEITAKSFSSAVDDIANAAKKAGIDAQIHPKATAALQRLQSEAGENLTLDSMTILRRVLKGAASSIDADERRIAMILVNKLDDYAERLLPRDVAAGDRKMAIDALKKARTLWSRYRKGEAIMEAVDRAGVRAGQFSGSGYENALRTEFRSIAMNQKRMRMYTKPEQATIRKVAMGGPVENVLRLLGKFAPRGIISATLSGGVGYGLGGPAGSAAVMGAGELGRLGATAMTKASASNALERMLTGKGPVTLTKVQADLLRAAIVGEQVVLPD